MFERLEERERKKRGRREKIRDISWERKGGKRDEKEREKEREREKREKPLWQWFVF